MADHPGKRTRPSARKNEAPPRTQRVGAQRWAWLVFAVAFAVNLNTLTNGWALDDTLLITQNTLTQQGLSAIPEIWGNDVFVGYFGKGGVESGGRYRPLSQTVFALEYALVGSHPFLGHVVNVLLYALTCVLLFKLLAQLFPESASRPFWNNVPLLASALYAVHPLHAEVVANIKSLDEILAMLFALSAALFALRSVVERRVRNLLLGAMSFLLALTAKENAITFLAVVPLVLYYATRDVERSLVPTAVLLIPTAIYFALRHVALGQAPAIVWEDNFLTNPFHGASMAERVATVLLILWKYVVLMCLPTPLTTDYYPGMVPVVGWSDFRVWLGLAALIGTSVCALIGLRKRTMLGFAAVYFLITYSVVCNLFINLGTPMNDRFLFMPLMGFAVALAWLLIAGIGSIGSVNVVRAGRFATVVIFISYAGLTLRRNRDWKDDLTLFAHDITVSGKSARCNVVFGKLCYEAAVAATDPAVERTYRADAERYLRRGLAIHDDYFLAWGLLGVLEMDRQNYPLATEHFVRCLAIDPTQTVALKNLGSIGRRLVEAKDTTGAERTFKALLRFDSTAVDPYLYLADIFMRSGKSDSSILLLDRLASLHPDNAAAYRMKGEIRAAYLGEPAIAEQDFLKAHALDPTDATVVDNLGVAAFQRKDFERALTWFLKAVELRPRNAHSLRNVASTYDALGDPSTAAEYRQRAAAEGNSTPQ